MTPGVPGASCARPAPRGAAPASRLRDEVLHGLRGTPKTLPPKLFYDAEGARLFERITELDEYYLTRTELQILREHAGEIADAVGPGAALLEYGSGAGLKVRLLLDALRAPAAYIPIDISGEQLARVAAEVAGERPGLRVAPVCADYTAPLRLPALPAAARRVAFFPGSTIGNFHPTEATAFLGRVRQTVGDRGALVLGVDLRKDPRVLHAAYNDAAGVTAAFNLNLLARLNRELGATFDPRRFCHHAFYEPVAGRIEMHLVSLEAQGAQVAGEEIRLERGEPIWTECSYKYSVEQLELFAAGAGFTVRRTWTDPRAWFCVAMLEPAPPAHAGPAAHASRG